MNVALLAISAFIVIVCVGIPVATHPHWFKTHEEREEDQPLTLGSCIPVLMLVAIGVLYWILEMLV